jgi:ectoine hydroxylase-related dioxygenase (phytanoyl-CoA dioxygenase family)
MIPFVAPAGSIVAMEGRVWHTSGANTTTDEDRPLLFAYYTKPFVRPQWNFSVGLRPEVQAQRSYASCRPIRITFDASSTVRSSGGAGSERCEYVVALEVGTVV